MTYRIEGLGADAFERLRGLSDQALAGKGARRVVADAKPGFPCRVTLEDAEPGETLILGEATLPGAPDALDATLTVTAQGQRVACPREAK